MSASVVLRTIRENREKQSRKAKLLRGGVLTQAQHKQLLIIDPLFKLDIVSVMNMRSEKHLKENEKLNTPVSEVIQQWINAGKDSEEQKNRKNGIQSLIKNGIVLTTFENGQEMSLRYFRERNGRAMISDYILNSPNQSEGTKKTYKVMYGSLWRFMGRFIYGPAQRLIKKLKPLKRGIRPFELHEAAAILNALEGKALSSDTAMRDLLIIRLLMYAGEEVEIKSILTLKREDTNFKDRVVKIKIRHSKKLKNVECSLDFMKLLKSYLGRRKLNLFTDGQNAVVHQDHINKRLERVLKEVNIENMTLKSIQRSFKYILKRNGLT